MFYIVDYNPALQRLRVYDDADNTAEWVGVKELEANLSRLESDFASKFYTEETREIWGNAYNQKLVPFEVFHLDDLSREPALRYVLRRVGITDSTQFHTRRCEDVVSVYNVVMNAYGDFSFLGTLYHDFDKVCDYFEYLVMAETVTDFTKFVSSLSVHALMLVLLYYRELVKVANLSDTDRYINKLLYPIEWKYEGVIDNLYSFSCPTIEEARYFYCMYKFFKTDGLEYSSDVEALYPDDIILFWNFINSCKPVMCDGNSILWKPEFFRTAGDLAKYKMLHSI